MQFAFRNEIVECCLILFDKAVVLGMCANPIPSYCIAFEQTYSSVRQSNSYRVDRLIFFDTLKEKTWMRWVVAPQFVCVLGSGANLW